ARIDLGGGAGVLVGGRLPGAGPDPLRNGLGAPGGEAPTPGPSPSRGGGEPDSLLPLAHGRGDTGAPWDRRSGVQWTPRGDGRERGTGGEGYLRQQCPRGLGGVADDGQVDAVVGADGVGFVVD